MPRPGLMGRLKAAVFGVKAPPTDYERAQALIAAIDAGGIPLNAARVNDIARRLGLDVSPSHASAWRCSVRPRQADPPFGDNRPMTSTPTPLQTLTLTRPDDWHLHVRDGEALTTVVPHTAAQFARAIIMPNLRPPVTTAAQALAYRERILAAVPPGVEFDPLMTLYLTDNLPADEIARAKDAGVVAVKLYPAGATTNSDAGVTDIRKTYPTLAPTLICLTARRCSSTPS